jgi:hypothetical protein
MSTLFHCTKFRLMFRVVFWDILPCKMIVGDHSSLIMEAVRTSETSVDNNFTRQYIPEDNPYDGGSTHL